MGLFEVLNINAAGMDVQQARLAVASSNLANSRTTHATDGGVYRPMHVVVSGRTVAVGGITVADSARPVELQVPVVASVDPTDSPPQLVYDPGHPDADSRGFVALPGVDPIASMLDLVSISRSYEANLRAFDVTRSLLLRALEIGNGR